MSHNKGRNIAIIGGGIGGLTAALAFARQRAHVTIYEQAPALTEVGAGVQITPNAMRVLSRLDLGSAIAASCLQAEAVTPVDGLTGRTLATFDLTGQSAPYYFCHRAALIDLLGRACQAVGVTTKLNARIDDIAADGTFSGPDGKVQPDVTIGADGIRSVLRGHIVAPEKPFFTGQVAWRAIVKQENAPQIARIWMLPRRHVVTYPLSIRRINVVAVEARDQWAEEGWHHKDDPANLRAAFADAGSELKGILAGVETTHLWGLFRHHVAKSWYKGSLVILGDAAHPTLPFLAQGANLAIEDGYVLAQSCNASADLQTAFADYQVKRYARVSRAIAAANANARNYHLTGVKRRVAHSGLRLLGRYAPGAFLSRLDWLYDHDVTA